MQSDDETPKNESDSQAGRNVALLRREVPVVERQRSMVLAGLLSFAGVALGFGLGQYGSANSNCAHSVVVHSDSHAARGRASLAHAPTRHRHHQDKVTWLGVVFEGQGDGAGAYIRKVIPGSPAETAGLVAGQSIVSLGETQIDSAHGLVQTVRRHKAGDLVNIRVTDSNGQVMTRSATFGELSAEQFGSVFRRR